MLRASVCVAKSFGARTVSRARLLGSTALVSAVMAAAAPAFANEATIGGVDVGPALNSSNFIYVGSGALTDPVVINVNDTNLVSFGTYAIGIVDTAVSGTIDITVKSGLTVTSAGFGIQEFGWNKDTTINMAGGIKSGSTGIIAEVINGTYLLDGKGTGTIDAGLDGINLYIKPLSFGDGDFTVKGFKSITGAKAGIWLQPWTGSSSVQGNGEIIGNGNWGVLVGTAGVFSTGDIHIGDEKTNGDITGLTIGIGAYTTGDGTIDIVTDHDVTGKTYKGIDTYSVDGDTNIKVKGGDVLGGDVGAGAAGIWAWTGGAGDTNIDIAAGSTVSGGILNLQGGVVVDKDAGGIGTVNNHGTITTNDKDVESLIGHWAFSAFTGKTTLNNDGDIIGRVWSEDGSVFTFNNKAGGLYEASRGLHVYGAEDIINNAGLTRLGEGDTSFRFLGDFNNLSGGVIDMTTRSALATDSLSYAGNFAPKAGSAVDFNFDTQLANKSGLGFDDSSDGKGTADTIVVTTATPEAGAIVNLLTTGGAPAALTGSVALVYTGVDLKAPDPGATLSPSVFYIFGPGPAAASSAAIVAAVASGAAVLGDPSTGAVVFALVDDGKGGVYLQWAPNVSASSLGGFGGALGDVAASSPATAISSAASAATGVGGVGLGGGPTGGGALGQIGDLGANASDGGGQNGGSLKDGPVDNCDAGLGRNGNAWASIEGEHGELSNGGKANSESLTGGTELGTGFRSAQGCSHAAIGIFGFTGNSDTKWLTGSNHTEDNGFGVYLRGSLPGGFYAALLGAQSWANADLQSAVFASTASRDLTDRSFAGTLGWAALLGSSTSVDLRLFASISNSDGGAFIDSTGIAVSSSADKIVTFGGSIGLFEAFTPDFKGFVRAGVKHAKVDSSIVAFGVSQNGSASEVAGSLEAGIIGNISDDVLINASAFGNFSDSETSFGGTARLTVGF